MDIDRYQQIAKRKDFIGKALESHVKNQVITKYQSLVRKGIISDSLSQTEMTNIVTCMTTSYIKDVLPDEVNFGNIGLFL